MNEQLSTSAVAPGQITSLDSRPVALVTGAAGFVGSHLSDELLTRGYRVFGVDNFATGTQANVDELQQRHPDGFSFIHHDITEPLVPGTLPHVDVVFNFACPASPKDFRELSVEIARVSADGTRHMLDLARQNNAVFVQASTSEVYGNPTEHPQKESYNGNVALTGERATYDNGKRYAEALIDAYVKRNHDLRARIVRIFNTYGPHMRANDGRVIPAFISQALEGRDLTIFGDGTQTRSLQYVPDLVDGVLRLAESDVEGPVNIGNPIELTIKDIAEKIIGLAGSTSGVIYVDRPENDPDRRRPDITRATELLGWEPKVHPDDGLRETIAWFRSQM